MSDEKPLDLRDKFAIEILGALISKNKDLGLYNDYIIISGQPITENDARAERIITIAYRMADIMRKIRLVPFE